MALSPRAAAQIGHILALVVYYLLPSFARSRIFPSPATETPKKPLNPTAYLDGLRGVAALIVCCYHWMYFTFPHVKMGYPTLEEDLKKHSGDRWLWVRLPFIHTLQSGRGSVAVFFVISGIVLSLRAVTLARQRRFAQALESLAQSAFRRPFRIYMPIFAITFFVAAVLLRFENFYVVHKYSFRVPPRENSTMVQLETWAYNMTALVDQSRFSSPGVHMYKPPYDGYLWTIPTEMMGSAYVFLLLLALLRVRPVVRVGVVGSLMLHFGRSGSMDMALFLAGMLLAEATVYLTTDKNTKQQRRSMTDVISQVGVYCMAITGFWMLGYPDEKDKHAYGFARLSAMTPQAYSGHEFARQYFWLAFGAILFVSALVLSPMTGVVEPTKNEYDLLPSASPTDSLPPSPTNGSGYATTPPPEPLLRRPFVTPFAQYLGRVSFALYLCHSTIIKTITGRYTSAQLHRTARQLQVSARPQMRRKLELVSRLQKTAR
jgi:peptidoglycan/LPS O-acetylase OafA/YrhL